MISSILFLSTITLLELVTHFSIHVFADFIEPLLSLGTFQNYTKLSHNILSINNHRLSPFDQTIFFKVAKENSMGSIDFVEKNNKTKQEQQQQQKTNQYITNHKEFLW